MGLTSEGIFDVAELNAIRDAHQAWCAENSVEPESPLGQEAVAMLLEVFRSGRHDPDQLLAALDGFVAERQSHVRLGTPAIESQADD